MRFYINLEHLFKEIDYPPRYQSGNIIKVAVTIFVIILFFLLLFRPFGVNVHEHKMNYFFICSIHALCPAIIFATYWLVLNFLRNKNAQAPRWTLFREYNHVLAMLTLTGVGSFLLRDLIYDNVDNWSLRYLWEEIRNCIVAGIFFYFFLRMAEFYFHSKKGSPFVLQFTPLRCEPEKVVTVSELFIKTEVKRDDFSLPINDLLFVKADGNYIELTLRKDLQVQTELKRISLTQFESQLSGYPHFFRCHRTYLVNMLMVENVSGNSQGYTLGFDNAITKVPVSRAQLESFNNLYQQLRNVN